MDPSSSFRLAGTTPPGATKKPSGFFGEVLQSLPPSGTMTPSNPQDNFMGLGMTKEDALKLNPDQLLAFGMMAGRQNQNIYDDPNRLKELMGVYSEFRAEEAEKANKIGLQRQAFQALLDVPKTIASVYSTIPAMYLAGRERGSTSPIPRSVSFQ